MTLELDEDPAVPELIGGRGAEPVPDVVGEIHDPLRAGEIQGRAVACPND